jgi:hypothetical protein
LQIRFENVKNYFAIERLQGEAGQHLALGKVFKPVGWAKPSLARSGSTSQGGKTGEKERSLRRQTPFECLEC